MSILLPTTLLILVSWQNYGQTLRGARDRAERTVDVLQEHALKVLETHRLSIDQINERLRGVDWDAVGTNEGVHELLKRLQTNLDQIATITITDDEGRMRASSRTFPATPATSFADRDWFQALKATPMDRLYVSRSYVGRQSGQSVFNVADRVYSPDGEFRGAIAISVDRSYFETFYDGVERQLDHNVLLLRLDGEILVRMPVTTQTTLPPGSPLRRAMAQQDKGRFDAISGIDGIERMFGYARIEPYPVYVGFGINKSSALAPWRATLAMNALVALLSMAALLATSALAIRHIRRERAAKEEVLREAEERQKIEQQLRQSQKMDAIGQLTGGIAHDFNNMLAVIMSGLGLARKRLARGDTDVGRLIDAALDGANRAATLTGRLMAFSRQQPLAPQTLNANSLVTGMSELVGRAIGETIALETVLGAGLWPVHADPGQLENAILNICVNARDAMPDGGKLTIETSNGDLDEAYAREHGVSAGQHVLIAITDTGTGMPPEIVSKVFEPFFTTKEVGKGTGLGLSQVHGFVKQSLGHLKIYSEPGIGTTIKIYLPRRYGAVTEDAAAEAPVPEQRQTTSHHVILVVEDDDRVRELTIAAVRELGYTVVHANGSDGALRVLDDHPEIALLFTDIVMPGTDGRKLATQALARRPGLKVLYTTGFTRNAIVHNGVLDAGVQLLPKPFTLAQLGDKLHQVLAADPGTG